MKLIQENTMVYCEECSSHMIMRNGFYVCPTCGLVSNEVVFSETPHILPKTIMDPKSQKTLKKRLRELNFKTLHKNIADTDAKYQIRRLLAYFKIPLTHANQWELFKIYKKIYNSLEKGTKYRNARKLVPIIFYYYYKSKIFLPKEEIIEASILDPHEFNRFFYQINEFLPKYGIEIKRKGILRRTLRITEELKLGMQFYHTAAEIISHLPSLLYTKNDIIAAIGTTLAKFVLSQDSLSVRKIALFFHTSMSCIQYHIKHKIAHKFNIPFTSLLDSKDSVATFVKDSLLEPINKQRIERKDKNICLRKYHINQYLSVCLINRETVIYVNGNKFRHCKYLLCNISSENEHVLQDIDSIDELEQFLDKSLERNNQEGVTLSSEQEYWGHCSNLEVWVEHQYDTRILHRNLAFPLLKELTKAGDPNAKRVFKEEIVKRFLSGNNTVIQFLLEEQYLEFLGHREFDFLLRALTEESLQLPPEAMLTLFNHAITHYEDLDFAFIFEKP